MSHPFGDLLSQHLHRKHGLSQSKLAAGILQDPSIIGKMCKGQRLSGPRARARVLAVITWLRQQGGLTTVGEANQLLIAAGMAALRKDNQSEQTLLQQLDPQPIPPPAPGTETVRHTNLPAPLTSFVGRIQELTEVTQLIATKRLVTLTGAGGVGKTRLALEAAKCLLEAGKSSPDPIFPDGIWLVELAALTEGSLSVTLVTQAIARQFKRPEQAGHTTLDAVQQYLADKHLLLVLDNCEHLVDACAEICDHLLQYCWQLHILATSREELSIPGETIYPVLPLGLPNLDEGALEQLLAAPAVQLFVERMGVLPSQAKPQAEAVAVIADICRRVDGIPLALELAAPLTRSMSLSEIAVQLDNQMGLLANRYRTAIPRHQTMHNALLWSYRLLPPEEQRLLARVSVFAGGWTLAAAKAVSADETSANGTTPNVATLLNLLIEKSLVLVETQRGERRYWLLEPVRQFAYAQLAASGEQELIQRRRAYYFLSLAEKMDRVRDTLQEREWLRILEPERNNLRAVNRWSFERNEVEFAHRFNGFLFAFWLYCSSQSEASHWLEGALALQSNQSEAKRTPLALLAEASVLSAAGYVAAPMRNFARALMLFERELSLNRVLDNHRGIANALRGISFTLMLNNRLSEAQQYLDQAIAVSRAAQDRWGMVWSLYDLGYLALVRGDLTAAQALLEEALPMLQEQGINFGVFRALLALGHLTRAAGNKERAYQLYTDALQLQQQMHYLLHIADGLEGMAALAATVYDPMRAVRLFGAAHIHRQSTAMPRPYHQQASYELAVALARSQLDSQTWDTAWAEGETMTLDEAVMYALAPV